MKIRNLITSIALASVLGAGVFAGVVANSNVKSVEAATETTVYYAVPSSVVGSYTVKLNINRKGDGDDWATYIMSRDGTKTQDGKLLYKYKYTDLYDGVGVMQFQLYEGDTWKGQQQPISGWTSASTYNGKVYVHDTGWAEYNPDTVYYTVTKYKVLDSASPVSIGSEQVNAGTSYARPANRYEAGYTFGGWYSNSACTTAYNGSTVNANLNLYAKYTSGTWSGTVHVDLRDSGWANDAANYAIMFMDKTTYPDEQYAWSSYVTGTAAGTRLVNISYNIPFAPLSMLIVRYNSTNSQASWNSDKWANKWNQTQDISFNAYARIGNITDGEGKTYAYLGAPRVIGGAGWSDIKYLESVKVNGSNNAEYYGEVALTAGTEFKVQVGPYADGDYYATYTAHKSIQSNFSGGGSANIRTVTAGTYEFYFDSYAGTIYITTVALAEADEWAQTFLTEVTCSGSGSITKDGWTTVSGTYSGLSSAAKGIFTSIVSGGDDSGTYAEIAVCRYDYIVHKYGTTAKPDFMGRIAAGKLSVAVRVNPIANNVNNGSTLIVVIVSAVSVSIIGGYIFLKRRKDAE